MEHGAQKLEMLSCTCCLAWAVRSNQLKSKMISSLYGRLNLSLVCANARALLLRQSKLHVVINNVYLIVSCIMSENNNKCIIEQHISDLQLLDAEVTECFAVYCSKNMWFDMAVSHNVGSSHDSFSAYNASLIFLVLVIWNTNNFLMWLIISIVLFPCLR